MTFLSEFMLFSLL